MTNRELQEKNQALEEALSKEEVEIDLFPDWLEAVPADMGMAAMMGNVWAKEVCSLIEKAWNLGFKAGAKGGDQ